MAAVVTQICIPKSWDVFDDAVCHDLAILLCCIMIQEKMLCAVYLMKVLILCGSTEKRSTAPMLGGVGWDTVFVSLL